MRRVRSARGLLLLLAVTPLGIVSAQSDEQERQLAPFSKLRVQNGVGVYLTQSDRETVTIEVAGFDLEDVVTEVVGDELRISRSSRGGGFGFVSHVRAYLDFVQLSEIEVSGGSDVSGRNTIESGELRVVASGGSDLRLALNVQQLDFDLASGSDLDAEGSAASLRIEASGGSDVSAGQLQAQRASVRLSGGSDASLRVRDRIEIEAHGGSDVVVYGDPGERTVDTDRSSDVTWR